VEVSGPKKDLSTECNNRMCYLPVNIRALLKQKAASLLGLRPSFQSSFQGKNMC